MKNYLTRLLVLCSISLLFFNCGENKNKENRRLEFEPIKTIRLDVPEPSGLDMTFDKLGFWTVSDETSKVYRLDIDGNVMRSFKIKGSDPEGIAVVDSNIIAVVLERDREVVLLDTLGKELLRKKLDLRGDLNSGLEGISYDRINEKYYLVNEKSPGLLIELDKNLNELKRTVLNLAKDYSGIFYESIDDVLWILSDESKKILITDKVGNIIDEYKTTIVQAEGITYDRDSGKLFVVSDAKEELYEYRVIMRRTED